MPYQINTVVINPQLCILGSILCSILIMMSFPFNVFAKTESTSDLGSLKIDKDIISIQQDSFSILQISGNIVDPNFGVRVILVVDKPDGSKLEFKAIPNHDGEYSSSLVLDANWEKGQYTLHATYIEKEIGVVDFVISDVVGPNLITKSIIGHIEVEKNEYVLAVNEITTIEIFGKINDYDKDKPITFFLEKPDSTTQEISVKGKRTGEYVARFSANYDWPVGTYYVTGFYDNNELGKTSFTLSKKAMEEIPKWIKNNAEWWSANQISDDDFLSGIRYLVETKIMVVPKTSSEEASQSENIPTWLRKNADWWSQDLISDKEFVNSIQYLIQKNIIQISESD